MHTSIRDVALKITGKHKHFLHPENMPLKAFRAKKVKTMCYERNNSNNEEVIASQMLLQTLTIMPWARELLKLNVSLTQLFLHYKFHFRTYVEQQDRSTSRMNFF